MDRKNSGMGARPIALAVLIIGMAVSGAPVADEGPPSLAFKQDGFTITGHFQAGANAVSERNLFWNLSETFAPQAGFDPDADWLELYVKPGVSFTFDADEGVTLYGKASAVASYTWGTDPFDARNTGRATWEEGYLGLRTDLGEGLRLDISAGPRELRLGTGMLISNGGSSGFERGALKFGPRKAWEFAAIARLTAGSVQATGFYIQPNEQRSNDSGNALLGGDIRYDPKGGGFLGVTYLNVVTSNAPYPQAAFGGVGPPTVTPGDREGLNAVSLYAASPPFGGVLSDLFLTADVAFEWNPRIDMRAYGGRAQIGHRFPDLPWSPVLTYSYQTFSGDDPNTTRQERFDPLYYDGGLTAWATGTKAAMLFINSNVNAHSLALRLSPSPKDTVTLRYARVRANELQSPVQFGQATRLSFVGGNLGTVVSGVTDAHLSDDLMIEYSRILNSYTFLTAGFSVTFPGQGIRAVAPGDTPAWTGGFVNLVVNF
ncbi:MAG: alginate export family protein [Pseudomonadota bacterium]